MSEADRKGTFVTIRPTADGWEAVTLWPASAPGRASDFVTVVAPTPGAALHQMAESIAEIESFRSADPPDESTAGGKLRPHAASRRADYRGAQAAG